MNAIFVEVPTKDRPITGFEIRQGFELEDFELMEAPTLMPKGSTAARELDGLSIFVLHGHWTRDGF